MKDATGRLIAVVVVTLACCYMTSPASAGPPFLTDDPEPTETGHWEIYAPAFEAAGVRGAYEGSVGAELNYGAAPDVQLTVGLPVSYVHERGAVRSGVGDLELSAKYRFIHDEATGFSVAVFPGLTLPTARRDLGAGRVTALIPVWAQKDYGPWSVFGGGGYAINPGSANRNYWTGGLALSRQLTPSFMAGVEVDGQGADVVGGRGSVSLGVGGALQLKAPFRLLASAGPTFVGDGGPTEFHAYVALGLDF